MPCSYWGEKEEVALLRRWHLNIQQFAKMKHFLLSAVAAILLCACKKDNLDCLPDLPCATQSGENTFGCYINGKPWVTEIAPYVLDPTLHKVEANYDEPNYGQNHYNILQFNATSVDSLLYSFWSMSFSPIITQGELLHGQLQSFRAEAHLELMPSNHMVFYIDTLSPYEIVITKLDVDKNIVSGKFAFTGITKDKNDTIRVTEGRFDMKYSPE